MNHRSLKVGLACAFGAFIGSIVALQFNQYWWWLGLVVGGGVGYFSYEFKKFLQAIPVAWKQVIGWRPNWQTWKYKGKVLVFHLVWGATIILPFTFLRSSLLSELMLGFVWLSIGIICTFVVYNEKDKLRIYNESRKMVAQFNPVIVYFYYVPKYAGIGAYFALKHFPWLTKKIRRGFAAFGLFVWTVFKFIHSEERVLCAFDAAVGAGIGYAYHNAILGMLAGGIFGVLNYEILSKRVLKLVPIRAKIQ